MPLVYYRRASGNSRGSSGPISKIIECIVVAVLVGIVVGSGGGCFWRRLQLKIRLLGNTAVVDEAHTRATLVSQCDM